jgi:hypothetical protein
MNVEQTKLPTPDVARPNAQVSLRHDAFAARGLKLDLSRESRVQSSWRCQTRCFPLFGHGSYRLRR